MGGKNFEVFDLKNKKCIKKIDNQRIILIKTINHPKYIKLIFTLSNITYCSVEKGFIEAWKVII